MTKKMAKIFGESGNLNAFVQNYEQDKVNIEKRLGDVEKKHNALKQRNRDDYESLVNMMQGFDKRTMKLELEKTAIRQELQAHKMDR